MSYRQICAIIGEQQCWCYTQINICAPLWGAITVAIGRLQSILCPNDAWLPSQRNTYSFPFYAINILLNLNDEYLLKILLWHLLQLRAFHTRSPRNHGEKKIVRKKCNSYKHNVTVIFLRMIEIRERSASMCDTLWAVIKITVINIIIATAAAVYRSCLCIFTHDKVVQQFR